MGIAIGSKPMVINYTCGWGSVPIFLVHPLDLRKGNWISNTKKKGHQSSQTMQTWTFHQLI